MSFKQEKYPQLMVYLTVRNCENSIEFYKKAFGFVLCNSMVGEDGTIFHAELKYGDAFVMMAPEGAWNDTIHKAPVTLGVAASTVFYVYTQDVDAFYQQAIAAGAKSILEPQDSSWEDRFCRIMDPEGYEWMFATFLGKK